ncbi:MAG: hypothetical protein HRU30_17515 [Rhodobacteraceae bacterium]|nr:hypothetical protein [Paracoccaceae bacterium]
MLNFVRSCFVAATALSAGSVAAQSTDPFQDPISAEVLPGWSLQDGRRVVGIKLTLLPGWKTYWRAPGEGGIPPRFDWQRAKNVAAIDMTWPTPNVYVQNGLQSFGYHDVVVIPVTVTPKSASKPVRFRGDMDLGVCSDVCMPHALQFDQTLSHSETRPTPVIAAALADAPYTADEAEVSSSVCKIRPTSDGLSIEAQVTLPHTGGQEVAVIEAGGHGLWVSSTKTRRAGGTLVAQAEVLHESGGAFSLNRSDVRITVIGADYAVDVKGCTAG